MSQLANALSERNKGTFPSQPEPNLKGNLPKGQYFVQENVGSSQTQEDVKAIITFRSGKEVEKNVSPLRVNSRNLRRRKIYM